MPRRIWRETGFLLLASVVLLHFLALCSRLIHQDLILSYPFMGGDAQDWVANGLYYSGHDVRYNARPPLLPLVIAGLHAFSALHLLPVLLQLLAHATMLGLYRLLCIDYPRPLAFTVTLLWLLNGSWQRLSLEVMADVPAACLLTWAVFFWRRSGGGRPGYVLAGLCGGLSAVTQQLAVLLPAAVLVVVLGFRRRDLKSPSFLGGAVLFLSPFCAWLLWQQLALGGLRDDLSHWSLLRFHTDSVAFYAYVFVAFVGLPAALAILVGASSFFRRARRDPWCAFVLGLQLVIAVFFVFFYDFNNLRFIAYLFPLSAVLFAEGLSLLRRPSAGVVAAALAVLWSLPFPGVRPDRHRIVLWPAPLTYLEAAPWVARSGSRQIDPFDLDLEVHPAATLLRHNVYSLVERKRRKIPQSRTLEPERFRNDLWGLYFYAAPEQATGHIGVTQRLGNLLLKRVHYLPAANFEPLWSGLESTRLGVLDGKALYRARVAGRAGSWILAVRSGSDLDRKLHTLPKARQPPPTQRPDLARAERIAALLDRRPTVLFASQGIDAWQTYLPLLVDTDHFFVIEAEREPGARRLLGKGRVRYRSAEVTLVEHEVFGWQWTAVEKSR